MAFYPVIKIPNFFAKTTLFNFPPNNWESSQDDNAKFLNATWAQDGFWHTKSLLLIGAGGYAEFCSDQGEIVAGDEAHIFLSLSIDFMNEVSSELPAIFQGGACYPQWRASMQISSHFSSTSYLGEISPFPPRSTCLSFGGMMQQFSTVKNFIIFMNLEHSPVSRNEVLELYNSITGKLINEFQVRNNSINLIELNHHQFEDDCLPVIICRAMGGIPLYFSHDFDLTSLSLEHTHPPSSFVVHGDRIGIQKELKNHWFHKCK